MWAQARKWDEPRPVANGMNNLDSLHLAYLHPDDERSGAELLREARRVTQAHPAGMNNLDRLYMAHLHRAHLEAEAAAGLDRTSDLQWLAQTTTELENAVRAELRTISADLVTVPTP